MKLELVLSNTETLLLPGLPTTRSGSSSLLIKLAVITEAGPLSTVWSDEVKFPEPELVNKEMLLLAEFALSQACCLHQGLSPLERVDSCQRGCLWGRSSRCDRLLFIQVINLACILMSRTSYVKISVKSKIYSPFSFGSPL